MEGGAFAYCRMQSAKLQMWEEDQLQNHFAIIRVKMESGNDYLLMLKQEWGWDKYDEEAGCCHGPKALLQRLLISCKRKNRINQATASDQN